MPKNNYFVRENASRHFFLHLIISLLFSSLTICFSINTYGQIAIQLSDIFKNITGKTTNIRGLDDRLFVVTTDGLWIIDKNDKLFVLTTKGLSGVDKNGKPINQEKIPKVTSLQKLGDQMFVIADAGLWYAIENGELNQVKEIQGILNAKTSGNQLYIGTSEGLWAIGKDSKTQYKEINGQINEIETFGENIFVNVANGSWIISKNARQPTPISEIKTGINQISPFGDRLFVNTNDRSWMIDKNHNISPINEVTGNIGTLMEFGDQLFISADIKSWVINKEGKISRVDEFKQNPGNSGVLGDNLYIDVGGKLWRIDKDGKLSTVNGIEGRIGYIGAVRERLFVAVDKDFLRIIDKNGENVSIREINARINGIYQLDDLILVNTESGSWLIDKDNKSFLLNDRKERVKPSAIFKDLFFVGTDKNLWIINSKDKKVKILENIKGSVENIVVAGKYVYVRVSDPFLETSYRIDLKLNIKAKLAPKSWWARFVSSIYPNWLPAERVKAEAYYVDENNEPLYDTPFPQEFRFAEASDRAPPSSEANGETMPSEAEFCSEAHFGYEIGWFNNNVHYWVKDKWGNTLEQNASYYGVPSQYFFLVLPIIFSVVFVLSCLALAPKVRFCHSAIMNPWLRKYFSLGSIPLLLSVFPSLRRHILRRYLDSINKDKEFSQWKERFVSPDEKFLPGNFAKRLENERRLLLTGQSGIGKTSFFKYLTAIYASPDKPKLPAKVFPVYISLTNYGGNSLEDLVYNQLFAYGEISDEDLAPMFWKRGGLLIFFDGVNEIQNVSDRQKLSEFVKKYWTSNYICLSSQQTYPEIENITEVKLKTFSREKICELIKQRVNGKEKAEKVITSLTDEDYQLYSIPRDLEFAIEILNSGKDSLPKSRTGLYKTVFSSLFAKWKENGDADAEDNLYKQAYDKLVQRDSIFDSVDNPKSKEITLDLYKQKFLVQREKNYIFRHDLIRSFLASEYFCPRRETLFATLDGISIDNNWQDMLRFSSENIENPNDVKDLVYEVLEKSVRRDVAEKLFEWLKIHHPSKCEPWEENFYIKSGKIKYGKSDFKRT